jgi:hypothetical protein
MRRRLGRGRQGTEEVTPRAMVLEALWISFQFLSLLTCKVAPQAQPEYLAEAAVCFIPGFLKSAQLR